VTRLIRIAYGDYKLQTIPPGMALPVPYKPVTQQKAKGSLAARSPLKRKNKKEEKIASPVKWVTSVQ
jgi:23S rRNA pseudouridine2605 synthase